MLDKKICPKCGQEKDAVFFHKSSVKKSGLSSWCIECKSRTPYAKELRWKRDLKNKYNISPDEYYSLLEQQDGGCAICGKTPEELGRKLFVDHDHSCCPGQITCGSCVRGLLCANCNNGLGLFLDNEIFLSKALEYVRGE
jgi:hypothetical protein